MKRALITGIAGSGGSHLAEFLVENTDLEVHGISRWHSTTSNSNLKNVKKSIKLVRVPKFSEVPYPVIMEPSLVIEYYSR